MYNSIAEMVGLANERNCSLSQVILLKEIQNSGKTKEEILAEMGRRYGVMKGSAENALKEPAGREKTMISGAAAKQFAYSQNKGGICGPFINKVMARALSCSEVNASMGKICAMPTAGSCGIVPSVLISIAEDGDLFHEQELEAFITAAGIGAVITENATVSGAEGGCQAECGVAASMAAAGAVELYGGTPEMCADACAFALINSMGLVCDPIAGLVQIPCAQRNASQAVNAILSADLAMGGMKSVIPVDEVVEAMYKVGKLLPEQLKETAMGGIAATKTGKRIAEKFFKPDETEA